VERSAEFPGGVFKQFLLNLLDRDGVSPRRERANLGIIAAGPDMSRVWLEPQGAASRVPARLSPTDDREDFLASK
jgi:hypothetical protein